MILSASLRYYIEPVAEALGVDLVLCTELSFDERGRASGELMGGNCRGQAKVDRLLAAGIRSPRKLWVYGDSAGDAELLGRAHEPTMIKGGRLVRSQGNGRTRA